MCVIIHKPRGGILPLETLQKCWDSNDDGAGYMYPKGGKVYGRKGFMEYGALVEDLRREGFVHPGGTKLRSRINLVIHFRAGTHGLVSPGQTHPFPVNRSTWKLISPLWKDNVGVAHNGIATFHSQSERISDTMHLVRHILAPIRKELHKPGVMGLVAKAGIGKLCFMFGGGRVTRLGVWQEEDGCYFSNKSFGYAWGGVTGYWSGNMWHNWNDKKVKHPRTFQKVGVNGLDKWLSRNITPVGTTAGSTGGYQACCTKCFRVLVGGVCQHCSDKQTLCPDCGDVLMYGYCMVCRDYPSVATTAVTRHICPKCDSNMRYEGSYCVVCGYVAGGSNDENS